MLSPKKNSVLLLCLLLVCCQKVDTTVEPNDTDPTGNPEETVTGTGEGTRQRPYTVTDIRSLSLPDGDPVWVIGYMVGTAHASMNNAVFSINATNQSNILISFDSLCTDTARCIPVELASAKNRKDFSLPTNTALFRKCLILKGIPRRYLYRKGLRNVSAGLWMDDFDLSSVVPQEWGKIIL